MVAKQKILIVDDDVNIAELISLYLTKECFDTKTVNDGEEALMAVSYTHLIKTSSILIIFFILKALLNQSEADIHYQAVQQTD